MLNKIIPAICVKFEHCLIEKPNQNLIKLTKVFKVTIKDHIYETFLQYNVLSIPDI